MNNRHKKIAEGIIYKVMFPNGKMYVGQTYRTLEKRKKQHENDMFKEDYPFYRALRKYGVENTVWEIIDKAITIEELDEKERYWIRELRTYTGFRNSQGYNANLGGNRNAIFGPLDDVELKEFGNDYRAGMSKNDLHNKYNINGKLSRHQFFEILNGKQWNEFTLIPRRDFSIEPTRSPFTPIQVDKILERFKECGDTRTIADEYGVAVKLITNIVKGKNWEKYTGIMDDNFYNKYVRWSTLLTNEEVLDIVDMGNKQHMSSTQIKEKYPQVSASMIRNICTGKALGEFTGVNYEVYQEEIKLSGNRSSILNKNDVDKIVEMNKNKISAVKIAKELGVSATQVDNVLKGKSWSEYTGITKDNPRALVLRKLTIEDINSLIKDKDSGMSVKELKEKYNISESSVHKYYRKYKSINNQ